MSDSFTIVSGVLPKSNVGRKAIPAKPELVEALVAAFNEATAEIINSDGDMTPKVYGPTFLFDSETKARTDAKRYVKALKESHERLCTVNVYPQRENYAAKIVNAKGETLRFVRVFGTNPDEATAAAVETLPKGKGQTVESVEVSAKYLWRLYVPISGTDGGRTEPLEAEAEDASEGEGAE